MSPYKYLFFFKTNSGVEACNVCFLARFCVFILVSILLCGIFVKVGEM
jgi:disulfide bond formation protein DsbB